MVSSSRIMFEGEPAVLTFCRDVTEEVSTRRELAASQERLSLALEAAQDGVWDWDIQAKAGVWDEAVSSLYGMPEYCTAACCRVSASCGLNSSLWCSPG